MFLFEATVITMLYWCRVATFLGMCNNMQCFYTLNNRTPSIDVRSAVIFELATNKGLQCGGLPADRGSLAARAKDVVGRASEAKQTKVYNAAVYPPIVVAARAKDVVGRASEAKDKRARKTRRTMRNFNLKRTQM